MWSGALVIELDPHGRIVRFNHFCESLTGYSFAEVEGRLIWDLAVPPEEVDSVRAIFTHLVAGQAPDRHENYWRTRDGGRRLVAWSNKALTGANGEVRFIIGTGIDITEQRRAERKLRESEERFRRVVESDMLGIFFPKPGGSVADANDYFLRLLGYTRQDLRAGHVQWRRFAAPEDAEQRRTADAEIRRAGTLTPFETELVRPDGRRVPVLIGGASLEREDGISVCFVLDLTERRLLEQELREAQKPEAIGRFAGGVAHDFNNLLTVILGVSETLLAGLPPQDPRRTSAEEILQGARRATGLTQQLLAFGRRQVFQLRVFDLNTVVAEMRGILQRLIGKRIQVSTIPGGRRSHVRADRGQIEQVIMNLALNARDAMPDGGRLSIATSNGETSLDQQDAGGNTARRPSVLLAVSDTGAGISPEVQAHMFEPFYTTKKVGEGTGLGFATVYGIVSQTGGRIDVRSAPGQGATFRILLPCVDEPAELEEGAPAASAPGGGETVLLVEDEAAVRRLLAAMLRRGGYQVLEAADGREALDVASRHTGTLHLLVTDVVMRGMAGHELARRLGHERPGLKTLFISGYSDEAIEGRGFKGSAAVFLQKPFAPGVLARRIREILHAPGPRATGH